MRRAVVMLIVVAAVFASSQVQAFHDGRSFELSANKGGGGGMFFTGAARWKRYDCAICHVGDARGLSVAVSSAPPELVDLGVWEPGRTYDVVVEMLGESRGLDAGANVNTFMAEVTDGRNEPAGRFDFAASELATWGDGRVIGAKRNADRTRWTFQFIAPPAGAGALSLDIGMVDGNGAGVSPSVASDVRGDGVAAVHITLCEANVPCEESGTPRGSEEATTAGGCAVGGDEPGHGPALGLLLVLWFTWTRRCRGTERRDLPGGPRCPRVR